MVPTGYGEPSGACVIDVCPLCALNALRNGTANSLSGPKHYANETPFSSANTLHGIQNILLI